MVFRLNGAPLLVQTVVSQDFGTLGRGCPRVATCYSYVKHRGVLIFESGTWVALTVDPCGSFFPVTHFLPRQLYLSTPCPCLRRRWPEGYSPTCWLNSLPFMGSYRGVPNAARMTSSRQSTSELSGRLTRTRVAQRSISRGSTLLARIGTGKLAGAQGARGRRHIGKPRLLHSMPLQRVRDTKSQLRPMLPPEGSLQPWGLLLLQFLGHPRSLGLLAGATSSGH